MSKIRTVLIGLSAGALFFTVGCEDPEVEAAFTNALTDAGYTSLVVEYDSEEDEYFATTNVRGCEVEFDELRQGDTIAHELDEIRTGKAWPRNEDELNSEQVGVGAARQSTVTISYEDLVAALDSTDYPCFKPTP